MATAKKAQVKSAKPVVKPVKMSSVVATPAPKLPTPRLPLTLKKLQEQKPNVYFATSGPRGELVQYTDVVWIPLNELVVDPEETIRAVNEVGDDAVNYAGFMEDGSIFPHITAYPDKTIRDGRTRQQAYLLTAPNPVPSDFLVPVTIVPKPRKLSVRLLDAVCDNASTAPRKMTKEDLRKVILRCRDDGMFQVDIKKHLEHSDFAPDVINKLIIEVDTNRQRARREQNLAAVRSGVITAAQAAKNIGEKWTVQMVKDAIEGKAVGTKGTDGTQAMRILISTLQRAPKVVAQNFRALEDAINSGGISDPNRYAEIYEEAGKYITNLNSAYFRARRNVIRGVNLK